MKLLIIADDLTGALDTGIQFSRKGIPVCVETGLAGPMHLDVPECPIVTAHSASRHLPADEAYSRVKEIAEAGFSTGADILYKKTDSGLRGRIGAELSALCRASGESLWFIPAYPEMNRITREGVHYIDGVPVAESPFGKDPVDPVRFSRLDDLLSESASVPVEIVPAGSFPSGQKGIAVFDCDRSDLMTDILREGLARGIHLFAGCAGFASALAEELPLPKRVSHALPKRNGLFVACGSIHPVSLAQIQKALSSGFLDLSPASSEWVSPASLRPGRFSVLHTDGKAFPDEDPSVITEKIQALFSRLLPPVLARDDLYTMIIGGDALEGLIRSMHASRIVPEFPLPGGAVLSQVETPVGAFRIITKSGGFGDSDLILELKEILCG